MGGSAEDMLSNRWRVKVVHRMLSRQEQRHEGTDLQFLLVT